MKRILTVSICIVLLFALGCASPAPAAEGAAASAAPAAEATPEQAPAAEAEDSGVPLFRLDAIESVDENGITTVKGTDLSYVPSAEGAEEYEYELVENSTVTYTVAPDVIIEFPLPEMDATVTITGAELDGEFREFLKEHDGGILFAATTDGGAITKLEYFYLP